MVWWLSDTNGTVVRLVDSMMDDEGSPRKKVSRSPSRDTRGSGSGTPDGLRVGTTTRGRWNQENMLYAGGSGDTYEAVSGSASKDLI
jgi:hypothetical protein